MGDCLISKWKEIFHFLWVWKGLEGSWKNLSKSFKRWRLRLQTHGVYIENHKPKQFVGGKKETFLAYVLKFQGETNNDLSDLVM